MMTLDLNVIKEENICIIPIQNNKDKHNNFLILKQRIEILEKSIVSYLEGDYLKWLPSEPVMCKGFGPWKCQTEYISFII